LVAVIGFICTDVLVNHLLISFAMWSVDPYTQCRSVKLVEQLYKFLKTVVKTLVTESGRVMALLVYCMLHILVIFAPMILTIHWLKHEDPRGNDLFEIVKDTCILASFLFLLPIQVFTRGGPLSSWLKTANFFWWLKGKARFGFRFILWPLEFVDHTSGGTTRNSRNGTLAGPTIYHIGDGEMVVMLWANENFDAPASR